MKNKDNVYLLKLNQTLSLNFLYLLNVYLLKLNQTLSLNFLYLHKSKTGYDTSAVLNYNSPMQ